MGTVGRCSVCCAQTLGLLMNEDAAAAKRCWRRAKEVRAIADSAKDRASRASLLTIATDYKRLVRLRLKIGKADRDSRAGASNKPEK